MAFGDVMKRAHPERDRSPLQVLIGVGVGALAYEGTPVQEFLSGLYSTHVMDYFIRYKQKLTVKNKSCCTKSQRCQFLPGSRGFKYPTMDGISSILRVHGLDPARILEFSLSLSRDSITQRFCAPGSFLPRGYHEFLSNPNGRGELVVVFGQMGKVLGVAEYMRGAGATAHVSALVGDIWQGKGIGKKLILAAVQAASRAGFTEVVCEVSPSNYRVINMMRNQGISMQLSEGLLQCALPISPRNQILALWSRAGMVPE
jgi:GNAT superfamily N-acetyltransferase